MVREPDESDNVLENVVMDYDDTYTPGPEESMYLLGATMPTSFDTGETVADIADSAMNNGNPSTGTVVENVADDDGPAGIVYVREQSKRAQHASIQLSLTGPTKLLGADSNRRRVLLTAMSGDVAISTSPVYINSVTEPGNYATVLQDNTMEILHGEEIWAYDPTAVIPSVVSLIAEYYE